MKTWLTAGLAGMLVLGCGDGTDPTVEVPAVPTGVSAKIESGNLVLTWDEVPGATSYNVYMAAEVGVKRANYTSLMANMFHPEEHAGKFDHPPGLNADMKYYLVVTAVNKAGESAESCEVGAIVSTQLGESC